MKKLIGVFLVSLFICSQVFAGIIAESPKELIQDKKWTVYFKADDGNIYKLVKSDNTEHFLNIVAMDSVRLVKVKSNEKE